MSEPEESLAAPDSTTREQRVGFSHGDDVLEHKDGKYYLGTVVEVDMAGERCLVNFMDNTHSWTSFKELTKLAMPDSDVMCVLCKKSQPKTDNDIIVCDKCGRGYHQMCHQPQIPKQETSTDTHWMCKRCTDNQPRMREPCESKTSMVKVNIRKVCSGRDQPEPPPDDMTKLPYDPNMLHWDAHHRVNAEQIYCYCGLNGEWYAQMLQCARCKQWFHEKCLRCLNYPLYSGDRFYVFVCSMCNNGKEFVRRLEMKWVDLVHLMLYNLTVYNAKKYYDLDTVIVPYANDNWYTLQLPQRIRDVTGQVRRESILAILTNNRSRFKCGREIKKRTTIWGLRVRLPPPCPIVNLPESGDIDDNVLRSCWGANKRLQYLPPQIGPVSLPESTKQLIALKQSTAENVEISVNPSDLVMRGTIYQNSEAEQSSCPSPNPTSQSTQSLRERYSGGGFVKKSFPFPKLSLQRRRRLMALGSTRERMLRKHKKREKDKDAAMGKSQGVREARYRKARKLLKNAIAKSKSRNSETSDLPPTPPTSVSGPPTPPATTSGMSELSVPSSVDLMHPMPPSTPADTSGDETSSRGTLDSFIPPPKDFEGKNNPFRNLGDIVGTSMGSLNQANSSTPLPYNQCPITLPLPLTPVIPQPPVVAKRQLSEKDIIVDRNGQVKRRRQHRRGRPPQQQIQQQFQQTASKTATILPARNNEVKSEFVRNLRSSFNGASSSASSQIGNCVDYALNGRRLRQRQNNEKLPPPDPQPQRKGSMPSSPKCSPVKQSAPDISLNELKSSVNIYFGAANRIAAGEKFVIKAKRIRPDGQTQYLIEWEGLNT
ncbi:metal-response element-binding transcription factor 2 isoform X1 [Harpegnathos saltator]|uniref:Metal-response element-binding transcription factor 2 n=1 Tax=Harpegnathos saltator TaxID=610380 RepID=E2C5V1_HARSA|nr:metal-response element-binding transcription factor 2 isoform X1 [Harpegnathos saltator]XP_025159340.1 metal-response element-binding transcription factor 2 isoform X1 [Harpegnathos saltator]XP_025159341.1 metal-response element-binding transcription factor 2 isoform X1 [Harpegnathos saltator]XP_025159342.1 metal-response element-binding transcription factor 2 isoform X1 [Harpegnathos saltator]XP_025159343.1 metal-response element-binding transcription factor 2 isoform X1 [Harpegnathos salta